MGGGRWGVGPAKKSGLGIAAAEDGSDDAVYFRVHVRNERINGQEGVTVIYTSKRKESKIKSGTQTQVQVRVPISTWLVETMSQVAPITLIAAIIQTYIYLVSSLACEMEMKMTSVAMFLVFVVGARAQCDGSCQQTSDSCSSGYVSGLCQVLSTIHIKNQRY